MWYLVFHVHENVHVVCLIKNCGVLLEINDLVELAIDVWTCTKKYGVLSLPLRQLPVRQFTGCPVLGSMVMVFVFNRLILFLVEFSFMCCISYIFIHCPYVSSMVVWESLVSIMLSESGNQVQRQFSIN